MTSWKDLLLLEWAQLRGRHKAEDKKTLEGPAWTPPPPQTQIMENLQAARLRLLKHLTRQRLYQGARTNCRWHESRKH